MALTEPTLIPVITASLLATGHLGTGAPQLATGVSRGVLLWLAQIRVTTVDAGTLGVGGGTGALAVPQPALFAAFSGTFPSSGVKGSFVPFTILGLANGLGAGLPQGQMITIHPGIGAGAGVASFQAPPATPSIIQGLTLAGMTGSAVPLLGAGIGLGLDIVFASLTLPVVIAGPPSPSAGAGVGFGQIV